MANRLFNLIALVPTVVFSSLPIIAIAQANETGENSLQGKIWQLHEVQYSSDETIVINSPARYTLSFEEDGRISLQADCNLGSGNYTLQNSQLNLELGPLTRAACPPDSYSNQYLQDLSNVASYVLKEGKLYLSLRVDGGILVFSPPSTSVQPLSPDLTGPRWSLKEITHPDYRILVTKSDQYTIAFYDGGNLSVRADCNLSNGSYTQTDNNLAIALGPTTLAACPPQSLSERYLRNLTNAQSYTFEGDRLVINFNDDLGTLTFDLLEAAP